MKIQINNSLIQYLAQINSIAQIPSFQLYKESQEHCPGFSL